MAVVTRAKHRVIKNRVTKVITYLNVTKLISVPVPKS
jgi:hypothetical protein